MSPKWTDKLPAHAFIQTLTAYGMRLPISLRNEMADHVIPERNSAAAFQKLKVVGVKLINIDSRFTNA